MAWEQTDQQNIVKYQNKTDQQNIVKYQNKANNHHIQQSD